MVDEYLSDDEQGEALKTWWRENWAWVLSGIVVGLGLLLGWQHYQRYRAERAEAAAAALDEFAKAQVNDQARAASLFKELTDKYSATPYSLQAQLLQAQHAVEASDFASAETALRVVVAGKDAELAQIAKLRLARVLIQQDKYDAALDLLDPAKAGAFAAQVHEVRGDAWYAKQDLPAARAEYQSALTAYQPQANADTSLLQLKLQDLGGAAVAPAMTKQASTK